MPTLCDPCEYVSCCFISLKLQLRIYFVSNYKMIPTDAVSARKRNTEDSTELSSSSNQHTFEGFIRPLQRQKSELNMYVSCLHPVPPSCLLMIYSSSVTVPESEKATPEKEWITSITLYFKGCVQQSGHKAGGKISRLGSPYSGHTQTMAFSLVLFCITRNIYHNCRKCFL